MTAVVLDGVATATAVKHKSSQDPTDDQVPMSDSTMWANPFDWGDSPRPHPPHKFGSEAMRMSTRYGCDHPLPSTNSLHTSWSPISASVWREHQGRHPNFVK